MSNGTCARCGPNKKYCEAGRRGTPPGFCSTTLYPEALARADAKYDEPENAKMALESARQEKTGYILAPGDSGLHIPVKSRIQETIELCQRMEYKKIGLAFCSGLQREAAAVAKLLEAHDLQVVSVICKVGGVDKSRIGIAEDEKLTPCGTHESMCNPIGQAEVLNEAGTDFNILLGLCVGHDSLFLKHSNAMCTVLAVKDRLMGHNPLGAIYTCDSYYDFLYLK